MKEIKKLEELGGMKVVKKEAFMDLLPFVEVLTEKRDNISGDVQLKIRLAARGDLQQDIPDIVYSPAAGTTEMRLFIAVMKANAAYVVQGDCPSAYLNGRLKEPVYLYPPEGHPQKNSGDNYMYKCPSSIYGLAVAGRVWYYTFKNTVAEIGFRPLQRAPTMFILVDGEIKVYLQLYVDDFLMASTNWNALEKCIKLLEKKFRVKCTTDINKFVGLQIENSGCELAIHQQDMITDLGLKYRVEKFFGTPMLPNLKWKEDSVLLEDPRSLQKIFGELNYIAGLSRPDIAYSVNRIARMLHRPTKEVYRSAKRIVNYLTCTATLGIKYRNLKDNSKWSLEAYSDSSFADIVEDKFKSTGGYLVYFNGSLISWKSKKLRYVCSSTGEAEYVAIYVAAKELLFIGYLILEAFDCNLFPLRLFCDNKAVVDTLKKAGPGEMRKYMKTKFFKVQEWVDGELLQVEQVASKDNPADGMTKVDTNFQVYQKMVLQPRGSGATEVVNEDTVTQDNGQSLEESSRKKVDKKV